MPNPSMQCKGKELLVEFPVNGTFFIGVYKGKISPLDVLIRYRQKNAVGWSRLRTPKHIHWAVDIMIKQHLENDTTNQLLDFLIEMWNYTIPFRSIEERKAFLQVDNLMDMVNCEAVNYPLLAEKGEYSVKFLILLAKLLMVQEKTNKKDAYMFEKLLHKLKDHKNIFEVVSIATLH